MDDNSPLTTEASDQDGSKKGQAAQEFLELLARRSGTDKAILRRIFTASGTIVKERLDAGQVVSLPGFGRITARDGKDGVVIYRFFPLQGRAGAGTGD